MPADTYTSILGLILQGTGNNDNTWGDNLNTLVIQYIEDAVAGRAAFSVTSADVTLTAAQARMAHLDASGTLTGNRNIIVPNASKSWLIRNNTSGSYTLGVKTSSGSAVTLPQGGWCRVWCDGSNVVYMAPSTVRHYAQADGTVALPYYSWDSDTDSGWYRIGANNLGCAVNGAKVLDVSTAGLGVTGTLTVSGAATFSSTVDVTGLVTQGGNAIVPIGTTVYYDGLTEPNGWLFSYGQAISRTTYSSLFSALTATATATRSNGSTSLTSVSTDFSALGVVGATIEGTGISTGTTITAVTATTITLSAAASGNGSITIRILPHGQGDGSTTFNVPDSRGRVLAGRDNMGGSTAGRLTSTYFGAVTGKAGTSLGAVGGLESHTLTSAESAAHTHTLTPEAQNPTFTYSVNSNGGTGGGATMVNAITATGSTTTVTTASDASINQQTTSSSGSGGAHNNTQPTRIANAIIFTGVFS